jgi:hypothetical protein
VCIAQHALGRIERLSDRAVRQAAPSRLVAATCASVPGSTRKRHIVGRRLLDSGPLYAGLDDALVR